MQTALDRSITAIGRALLDDPQTTGEGLGSSWASACSDTLVRRLVLRCGYMCVEGASLGVGSDEGCIEVGNCYWAYILVMRPGFRRLLA